MAITNPAYVVVEVDQKDVAALRKLIHKSGIRESDMVWTSDRDHYIWDRRVFGPSEYKNHYNTICSVFADMVDGIRQFKSERARAGKSWLGTRFLDN